MTDFATPFARGLVQGVVGLLSQPLVAVTLVVVIVTSTLARRRKRRR